MGRQGRLCRCLALDGILHLCPARTWELVRSIYAAWERRDYVWVDWADPAIEFVVADGPSPGHWDGLAGMWRGWRDPKKPWDDWRVEHLEYRELDAQRVLVFVRLGGRGKTSRPGGRGPDPRGGKPLLHSGRQGAIPHAVLGSQPSPRRPRPRGPRHLTTRGSRVAQPALGAGQRPRPLAGGTFARTHSQAW